jgi:hypothetical protein
MTKGQEIGSLKKQLKKALDANMDLMNVFKENEALISTNSKLNDELIEAKKQAAKFENLFLQVSSYCACQKKAVGK